MGLYIRISYSGDVSKKWVNGDKHSRQGPNLYEASGYITDSLQEEFTERK